MNLKKILLLPAGFLAIHLLYVSCCKCLDTNEPYNEIAQLLVSASGSGNTVVDNGVPTTVDSIRLYYTVYNKCVAYQNPFSGFVSSAYACDCKGCGYDGLKSKIKSITITSDSIYNGVAAGSSLNDNFKAVSINANNVLEYITIDSLRKYINTVTYVGNIPIVTGVKPTDFHGHKFTFTIQTEDNKTVMVTTKRINWF
ncbi:MAG: hypothetical protein JNL23_04050 [Chitinophagaceae bacterium]|nr:hypothetical protein [Chitinophagaceae bacterium]